LHPYKSSIIKLTYVSETNKFIILDTWFVFYTIDSNYLHSSAKVNNSYSKAA